MKTLLCTLFLFLLVGGSTAFAAVDATDIERELTNLEINLTNSMWSTQSLIEQLSSIKEKVKRLQPSRPDIEKRVTAIDAALLPRLSKDVNAETRRIIEDTRKGLASHTGADYLTRVKEVGEAVAETRRGILMLSENPETQFIQIEDETHKALDSLEREVNIRIAAVDAQAEARQRVEAIRNELADYTGVEHLAQITAAMEAVARTKSEIIALSKNPEVQYQYIPIEDATRDALTSIEGELSATRGNICIAAAKAQCVSSLPDFPEKYRYMTASPDGETTILDIACAAQHRGFYKGFSAGGIFSSEIVLKLEMATIYFKEQRLQRDTHRPVGSGYTGDDTYIILVATKIETEKGTQEVKNSAMEMMTLYGHLGGIPNVKECQE